MRRELLKSQSIVIREKENGGFYWEVDFARPTQLPQNSKLQFDWQEKQKAVLAARDFVTQCKPAPGAARRVLLVVRSLFVKDNRAEVEVLNSKKPGKFAFSTAELDVVERKKLAIGSVLVALVDPATSNEEFWSASSLSLVEEPSSISLPQQLPESQPG